MIEYTTLGNLIAPAKVIRCGKGSFPVLSMTMHDGIVLQSERFKKSLASIDQSDYKVVKRGQLVVGFPIDEGVLYVQKAADEGIMSPAYNVWDIDTEKVDPDFLELCLHSPQSMQYYKDKLRGTTARRRSIPTADLLALKIRLPDMQTQREAVAIMRKAETVIVARQEQLDSFEQLVKSRFIELFGTKESPKCDVVKLSSLVKYQQGTQVDMDKQFAQCTDGMTRFLRIIDYTQGNQEPRYVENKGTYVYADTVCIVRYGTVGFVCKGYEGILANNLFKLDLTTDKMDNDFLYCVLKYGTFENDIKALSNGATMSALSFKIMDTIDILLPSIEKQMEYTTFVEQTDKSKLAVQQGLQELEILKKSLMQQYFG